MKNKKIIIIIAILISSWAIVFALADQQYLEPKLEQAIKEQFQVESVNKQFVRTIETLDLSNQNLSKLDDLKHFKALKDLNLSNNSIEDVSFLLSLPQLEHLNLSNNAIQSIAFNQKANSKLLTLNLEQNALAELGQIHNLSSLVELNLRNNKIESLAGIEQLTLLERLNVRENLINDLQPLKSLPQLIDLNLRDNRIEYIDSLAQLELSERLYLSGNAIKDYQPLKEKMVTIADYDFEIPIPEVYFKTQTGVYEEPFELWLATEEHHQIYYTLDGSNPTVKSHKYDSPIIVSPDLLKDIDVLSNIKTSPIPYTSPFYEKNEISEGVVITAASYVDGQFGKPVSHTFLFSEQLFERELPVLSIKIDPKDLVSDERGLYVPGNMYEENRFKTGNYYQSGRENEKEVQVEYILPDQNVVFRQRMGMRPHGNYTRVLPQKSIRLYAREDYGQSKIISNFFQDVPYFDFEQIIVRNSGNDNHSTLLRDGVMQSLLKESNLDLQAYQPTIVLMNGEYWGLFNLRERYNARYIEKNYQVSKQDLVMLSVETKGTVYYNIDEGKEKDKHEFENLMKEIPELDPNSPDDIAYVESKIDIDNYLRYVVAQTYFGNMDSFMNNMTVWKKDTLEYNPNAPKGHDGRYRFMIFDLDWGMGYADEGIANDPNHDLLTRLMTNDRAAALFRFLMGNEKFRNQYISMVLTSLENEFRPEAVVEQVDELSQGIEKEIPFTIKRWGNIESVEKWEEQIQFLKQFAYERPAIVIQQLQNNFPDFTQ